MTCGTLVVTPACPPGHAVQAGSADGGTKAPLTAPGPVAADWATVSGFILGCALGIIAIIAGVVR